MAKIVVNMMVSLDGIFEGPGGDLGWHRVDEELHAHFNEVLAPSAAFVEGRVVYELMESFWPGAAADPAAEPTTAEFAGIWRDTPKIVYSRILTSVGPNARIVREIDPAQVRALADAADGDLRVGGARLASAFRRHGLVDEWHLYVNPVVVGAGRPLFAPEDGPLGLDLLETRRFGNGVALLRYGRGATLEA